MNSNSDQKNIFETITNCADSHLMQIRLSIGALGLIGMGVALRSIRFATKFYANNKIPKSFVNKNIRLRGVVRSVSTDGTLNVDHIPIISMPWHRSVQSNSDRLLSVSLAAIEPTISGTYWLKLNVENKMVWFRILWRNDMDINCIVSEEKKILFKKTLNAELVYRGLAFVRPYEQRFNRIDSYKHLYKTLVSSETKAKKNNSGLWYEPTKWDRYVDSLRKLRNVF